MFEVIFLFVLGLVWIVFASIQDIRTREVANWISFSLIILALAFRFFYSLFNSDFSFFYQGLIGLVIFFVLGNLLYYSRVFAGGDTKLMIALGAVLGFSFNFMNNLKLYGIFLFLFLFSGALYGTVMAVVLASRNFKEFKKYFLVIFRKSKKLVYSLMGLGIFIALFVFFDFSFLILGVIIFLFPYVYLYAKAVDNSCMVKKTSVRNLTEGDWLYESVKVGKKTIAVKWEGLSKEEIKEIKKHYKFVKIKQGIAFVPVFLIAYLVFFIVFIVG
jgi:Flp pilus assembly protein protease CpaA